MSSIILVDFNFIVNNESPYKDLIRVHALKISTSHYNIIDTFHMYIIPITRNRLSKNITNKTGITNNDINNYGTSYRHFIKIFYNFSLDDHKFINIFSYDDFYQILLNNMNLNNIPENSKFRSISWKNKFNDIKPIIKMYGIDTEQYTSKNIYCAINTKYNFKEININDKISRSKDITWNLYHLYIAIKKMLKIK